MNFIQKSILILAPLSPYVMNLPVPTDTTSHWSVEVAAGIGQMADVSRDCEGNVLGVENFSYSDFAAGVRYTDIPFTASVSGGVSSAWMEWNKPAWVDPSYPPAVMGRSTHQTKSVPYCVPMIGIDTKYVGMEIGFLTTFGQGTATGLGPHGFLEGKNLPAGSLRLGNRGKTHFSAGLARNIPLCSGGGLIDLGVATPVGHSDSWLFFGAGLGPYDGGVIVVKGDLSVSDRFQLTPRVGVKSGDAFEYGLAIGGRFRF